MNIRMNEIQQWNEQDVIGSMLVDGDMTPAILKDLTPNDFRFKAHREIYIEMLKIQTWGKFDTSELFNEEHIERGKNILDLMDRCLATNIPTKCAWILNRSVERYVAYQNDRKDFKDNLNSIVDSLSNEVFYGK